MINNDSDDDRLWSDDFKTPEEKRRSDEVKRDLEFMFSHRPPSIHTLHYWCGHEFDVDDFKNDLQKYVDFANFHKVRYTDDQVRELLQHAEDVREWSEMNKHKYLPREDLTQQERDEYDYAWISLAATFAYDKYKTEEQMRKKRWDQDFVDQYMETIDKYSEKFAD